MKEALRGLHYRRHQVQEKPAPLVAGEVFDVAADLGKSSPAFGQWTATVLSAENKRQMWIPAGFTHGFPVTSESADFLYKVTDYYARQYERAFLWHDPAIGIAKPSYTYPLLSIKDGAANLLHETNVFP